MDILDLIEKYHRRVETLFADIERAEDMQKLYECFNQLSTEISLHAATEQQTLFPAIRNQQNIEQLAAKAQARYHTTEQMLEEIESFSPTSVEFRQKIQQLHQIIRQYVQEEEQFVLPLVRDRLSQSEREQLGKNFAAAKSQKQSESILN